MDKNVAVLLLSILKRTDKIPIQCNIFSWCLTRAVDIVTDYWFWNKTFMSGRNESQIFKYTVYTKNRIDFITAFILYVLYMFSSYKHIWYLIQLYFYFNRLLVLMMPVFSGHIIPLRIEALLEATKRSIKYCNQNKCHVNLENFKFDLAQAWHDQSHIMTNLSSSEKQ